MNKQEFCDLMQFHVIPEVTKTFDGRRAKIMYTGMTCSLRSFMFMKLGYAMISSAANHGEVIDVYSVEFDKTDALRSTHMLLAMNGTNAVFMDVANDDGNIDDTLKLYQLEIPIDKIPSRFHNRKHAMATITNCWNNKKIRGSFHRTFTWMKINRLFTKSHQ